MTTGVEWIAADWGTSNVRVWGLSQAGERVFSAESDKGMGRLNPTDYPDALMTLVANHADALPDPTDVVICGMAGARQGWMEAPYLDTPADLNALGAKAVAPAMPGGKLRPRILSGVCQRTIGQEDVMRGEETQILGLLALKPGYEGTVVMPGTHCKWVRVENDRITEFSTAMTGELFDVLGKHTVLRHSMPERYSGPEMDSGIADGVDQGLSEPELLGSNLFRVRAAALLSGKSPEWCAGFLSGLLIGSETASRKAWLGDAPVQLLGSQRLAPIYANALTRLGKRSETVDVSTATLAGLTAAREQMK